jgi:hypothetical protein
VFACGSRQKRAVSQLSKVRLNTCVESASKEPEIAFEPVRFSEYLFNKKVSLKNLGIQGA